MHTGSLAEQVAVVTGASSGIGLAVAKELRALGLRPGSDREVRSNACCRSAPSWQAEGLVADITDATVPQRPARHGAPRAASGAVMS